MTSSRRHRPAVRRSLAALLAACLLLGATPVAAPAAAKGKVRVKAKSGSGHVVKAAGRKN